MKLQETVLIAEDDANDYCFLRRAFEVAELSCTLMHVQNGREAADYLSGLPPYFDRFRNPLPQLLVTDLNMPLMNGMELLFWLRGRTELNPLPAVVLSSSGLESDRTEALALGARAYHVKPTGFGELVDLVRGLNKQFLEGLGPRARHLQQFEPNQREIV